VRTILILAVLSALTGAADSTAAAQAAGDQVYKPGNGVTSPVLVREVKANYTEGAMRRRVQGTVVISCVVLTDGKVGDCAVTRPLDAELDQAAVEVAKQWQFKPGMKDGEPVAVEVSIEMSFSLRGNPPVYTAGAGVSVPVVVSEMKPDYPADAMQSGIQGTVELEGIVEIDGSIGNIRVKRGLDERLDREAVKALGQWRFRPGQKGGQDVRVRISIEMTFSVR
jgi:TonB family protein